MNNIDRYAVFGQPIKHSKSPRIHQLFAAQTGQSLDYTAQEVSTDDFGYNVRTFFAEGGKGLNCTVPLKELAWQLADVKTQRAELSKAVNTLVAQKDGTIKGDNTDGVGLINDLTANHAINLHNIDLLILGAGGASRGIIGPLLEQQPNTLLIANRTIAKAIQLAEEFQPFGPITASGFAELAGQQFDLILNATSASLSNQLPPLVDDLLAKKGVCYDLAYANEPTAFVRWGWQQNAGKSLDGLGMLVEQAAEAFYIWRGIRPDTQPVIELLNSERGN
jgi:shikimate dehydrogenase